jgi:hypothetical protein
MPLIRNKHLIWAVSVCSLGCILLGIEALLSERRGAAAVVRLAEETQNAEQGIANLRHALESRGQESLRDREAVETALGRLGSRQDQIEASVVSLRSIADGMNRLADGVVELSRTPWRAELKRLEEKLTACEQKLSKASRSSASEEPALDEARPARESFPTRRAPR